MITVYFAWGAAFTAVGVLTLTHSITTSLEWKNVVVLWLSMAVAVTVALIRAGRARFLDAKLATVSRPFIVPNTQGVDITAPVDAVQVTVTLTTRRIQLLAAFPVIPVRTTAQHPPLSSRAMKSPL